MIYRQRENQRRRIKKRWYLGGELFDLDLGPVVLLGEVEQVVEVVLVAVLALVRGLARELHAVLLGHVVGLDPNASFAVEVVGRDPEVAHAVLRLVPRLLGGEDERLVGVLDHQLRALALLVNDGDTDAERRGKRVVRPPASEKANVSVHEKKKVVALMADDGIPFAIVLGSLDLDGALNGKVEPLVGLEHEALIVIAHGVAVVTALRTKPVGVARFVSKQATTIVLRECKRTKGKIYLVFISIHSPSFSYSDLTLTIATSFSSGLKRPRWL